jgi:hypothetical protein
MGRTHFLLLAAAAAPLLASGACETVDLGDPPADINSCRPSQQWFIDQIWPNVLANDTYPNGVHCYDSTCHGALAPNALDLIFPTSGGTVPLMAEWADNYMSVTEEMNCANVAASRLLEYPSGLRTHGGGKLFEPTGNEAMLIKMWISQP